MIEKLQAGAPAPEATEQAPARPILDCHADAAAASLRSAERPGAPFPDADRIGCRSAGVSFSASSQQQRLSSLRSASASRAVLSEAQAQRDTPCLLEWCRRVGMPDRAINNWLDGVAQPSTFLVFTFVMLLTALSADVALYFPGLSGQQNAHKVVIRTASALTICGYVTTISHQWRHGPITEPTFTTSDVLMILIFSVSHVGMEVASALAPLHNLPFRNRIAFLALTALLHWAFEAAYCAGFNPAEKLLRRSHLGPVAWAATVRTARAIDVLSDMMYVRLLHDLVCPSMSLQ